MIELVIKIFLHYSY